MYILIIQIRISGQQSTQKAWKNYVCADSGQAYTKFKLILSLATVPHSFGKYKELKEGSLTPLKQLMKDTSRWSTAIGVDSNA